MAEAGQLNGILGQLDPHQRAVLRQHQFGNRRVDVVGNMRARIRSIRDPNILHVSFRLDKENKTGPKGMGRAHQIADIARLADALDSHSEITALRVCHFSTLP